MPPGTPVPAEAAEAALALATRRLEALGEDSLQRLSARISAGLAAAAHARAWTRRITHLPPARSNPFLRITDGCCPRGGGRGLGARVSDDGGLPSPLYMPSSDPSSVHASQLGAHLGGSAAALDEVEWPAAWPSQAYGWKRASGEYDMPITRRSSVGVSGDIGGAGVLAAGVVAAGSAGSAGSPGRSGGSCGSSRTDAHALLRELGRTPATGILLLAGGKKEWEEEGPWAPPTPAASGAVARARLHLSLAEEAESDAAQRCIALLSSISGAAGGGSGRSLGEEAAGLSAELMPGGPSRLASLLLFASSAAASVAPAAPTASDAADVAAAAAAEPPASPVAVAAGATPAPLPGKLIFAAAACVGRWGELKMELAIARATLLSSEAESARAAEASQLCSARLRRAIAGALGAHTVMFDE